VTDKSTTDIQDAINWGCKHAFRIAAHMLMMSDAEIRLHAGELTANEMRAVQAVLKWKAAELRACE